MGRITLHSEVFHGACLMALNLPVSFRTQYFEANNMILEMVIEIGSRKSFLAQFLKIENVDLAQVKPN